MSTKSAMEFIERIKNDNNFASRSIGCKDADERMAMAKAEGFEFSPDEINRLQDTLTDDDVKRTIFQESQLGYDSPLGHGQDPEK
jgi:predicted ribosomally synthesized peptide with nif11-like leader